MIRPLFQMELPKRKSIRLPRYNYSNAGWYFVTICTENRECLFGNIVYDIVGAHHDAPDPHHNASDWQNNGCAKMGLNQCGQIVKNIWETLPKRFPVILDEYQIMPNHVHGMIVIKSQLRAIRESERAIRESPLQNQSPQKRSLLSQIIGYFKMNSTKQIRQLKNSKCFPVWQRNFYEYIIRDENELKKIREYIIKNPLLWNRDRNNPNNST